jgi:hypothetical protein
MIKCQALTLACVPLSSNVNRMNIIERQTQSWRRVAQELDIQFEAPFVLEYEGTLHTYLGHLPQFGSARGMLVMLHYEEALAVAASAHGFGYSSVELGEEIDCASVVEMLQDWGWASAMAAPVWCREV